MHRRTALKSIAAAFMAPMIKLRNAVPDERLMQAFCCEDYWKYDLQSPFGVGQLTYATDSFAMIRAELPNRIESGERKTPPVTGVWADHWQPATQWRPLEPDDIVPTKHREGMVCPECGGRRISFGDSFPDISDPVEDARIHRLQYDVDDNSIGDESCAVCHGMEYRGPNIVNLFGTWHQSHKLKRILALPNAMVCRSQHRQGDWRGKYYSLLFRADGFEGISLGVVQD